MLKSTLTPFTLIQNVFIPKKKRQTAAQLVPLLLVVVKLKWIPQETIRPRRQMRFQVVVLSSDPKWQQIPLLPPLIIIRQRAPLLGLFTPSFHTSAFDTLCNFSRTTHI